jgi:hypothetical protein
MTTRSTPRPTWLFDLAAFLAVLVTAIILISAVHAGTQTVRAVTDAAAAYLAWRIFAERRRVRGDIGPLGHECAAHGHPGSRQSGQKHRLSRNGKFAS